MGLFAFLKRKTSKGRQQNKNSSKQATQDIVSLTTIQTWLKNRQHTLAEQELAVCESVRSEIRSLQETIDEKLRVLETVDINAKKVDNRSKMLVRSALKTYLHHVNRLMKKSASWNVSEAELFALTIEKHFADFFRRSEVHYQKANFLVGKELTSIKDALLSFYKYQKKLFDDNKRLLTTKKTLSSLQSRLDSLHGLSRGVQDVDHKVKSIQTQITDLNDEIGSLTLTIETLKKSEEYTRMMQTRRQTQTAKSHLEDLYTQLRQLIDFKALAQEFHGSQRYMAVVKAHRDDFMTTVAQDSGEALLDLLREANLSSEEISSTIVRIKELKEDILDKESSIQEDKVASLQEEMKRREQDIQRLIDEKEQELSVRKKILDNKQSHIDSLKDDLSAIGVVLRQ